MSIYIRLFLTFLKIGAVSFGGGYGMIPLIREECLNYGWLTEEEILNFIAISESTPGPIAVNMATFVGASEAGFFGALLATLGVILPAFIIVLLISSILKNILKIAGVKVTLESVRPAVVGLILGTSIIMLFSVIFNISTISSIVVFDWKGLILLAFLSAISTIFYKFKKKSFSPILLILISGILGVILYL